MSNNDIIVKRLNNLQILVVLEDNFLNKYLDYDLDLRVLINESGDCLGLIN